MFVSKVAPLFNFKQNFTEHKYSSHRLVSVNVSANIFNVCYAFNFFCVILMFLDLFIAILPKNKTIYINNVLYIKFYLLWEYNLNMCADLYRI